MTTRRLALCLALTASVATLVLLASAALVTSDDAPTAEGPTASVTASGPAFGYRWPAGRRLVYALDYRATTDLSVQGAELPARIALAGELTFEGRGRAGSGRRRPPGPQPPPVRAHGARPPP